jgi:lipid A 4'-phosphatase
VRRLLWVAIGTAAVLGAVLVAFPQLDLAISGLAYRSGDFLLPRYGLTLVVSWLVSITSWLAVAGALVLLAATLVVGRPLLWGLDAARLLLVVLTFVVAPGLIVNSLLKQHWGRARPVEIEQFGGDAQFSRAGVPAAQCRRNCAFPSGDAAAAFALTAVGVAASSTPAVAAALAAGILVGTVRVLNGAHFASDVVFSALFSLLTIAALDRLLLRRPRAAPR